MPLTLVTCLTGAPWRDLEPELDGAIYELFDMAYRWQDRWDEQQHVDFWQASLPLWPRKTGQRQMTDELTQWALKLRAAGASDREAESLMGYRPGSLRRN